MRPASLACREEASPIVTKVQDQLAPCPLHSKTSGRVWGGQECDQEAWPGSYGLARIKPFLVRRPSCVLTWARRSASASWKAATVLELKVATLM